MKKLVLLSILSSVMAFGCPSDDDRNEHNVVIDDPVDMAQGEDAGDAGTDAATRDGGADMGGPDTCVPESDDEMCQRLAFECGPLMAEDNCGTMREIDSCGDPATVCEGFDSCGGGGDPGQCGCTRASCEELGVLCGEVEDTCGGTLMCDLFCVDSITAGGSHACAIGSGNIKCWGEGGDGQLGNGSAGNEKNPVDVDWGMAAVEVVSASAGGAHSCVVDGAGRVVCWGENERSQLGIGTSVDSEKPGAAAIMSGAMQVRSGEDHACALSENGKVSCWGSNDYGQIGDSQLNLRVNIGVPTVPDGLDEGVVELTTGWNHTCVLQDIGADSRVLKCWGRNRYGQVHLEPNTTAEEDDGGTLSDVPAFGYDRDIGWDLDTLIPAPIEIADPENGGRWTDIKAVAAGGWHTCVIDSQDRVWCWGHMPGFDPDTSCPQIEGSAPDTCSVFPRGGGMAIGRGDFDSDTGALLGISSPDAYWVADEPTLVAMDKTPISLSAGHDHHCMLISDPDPDSSNVMCFGRNGYGQVGDGTTNNWSAPRTVFLDVNDNPVIATQIEVGDRHTCALVNDSNVKCWGSNASGQIGNSSLQRDESYRPYDVKLEYDPGN